MEVKINNQDGITTAQLIGRLDTPASQEISGDFDNLTASLCGELLLKGVSVFRVHDIKKTKDVIKLYSALI